MTRGWICVACVWRLSVSDVQTGIAIPEAADYQAPIREKKQKEWEARDNARDLTEYDVAIAGCA